MNSFPTLIYFANNSLYEYKIPRSPENLLHFAIEGYKDVEPEEIPLKYDFWNDLDKSIGRYTLIGFGIFIFIVATCCICSVLNFFKYSSLLFLAIIF